MCDAALRGLAPSMLLQASHPQDICTCMKGAQR